MPHNEAVETDRFRRLLSAGDVERTCRRPSHTLRVISARAITRSSRLGYGQQEWGVLSADLRRHAAEGEANEADVSILGRKYEVGGELTGPSGRSAQVITVWIILEGGDFPRFVTALPGAGP